MKSRTLAWFTVHELHREAHASILLGQIIGPSPLGKDLAPR